MIYSTVQWLSSLFQKAFIIMLCSSPRSMEISHSTIQNKSKSSSTILSVTNQDVVRIYVPPAEDMFANRHAGLQCERGEDEISQSSNRSSIIQVEYDVLLTQSTSKADQMLPCASKVQPQQYYYYPNPHPQQTVVQSSSSRRGSMTSKTPSPLLNDLIVCDHMKIRRSYDNLNEDTSITYSVKRMTSFEELAKKSDSNSMNGANNTKSHNIKKSTSNSYNIQRTEKQSSSDINSPFDYDLLEEKKNKISLTYDARPLQDNNDISIKSYDRFFNSDDELEDDEIKQKLEIKHSREAKKYSSIGMHKYISGTDEDDENSSNSPTNKSILNTPVNDTVPLLLRDPNPIQSVSQALSSVLPSSSNSLRQKSKIPRPSNRGSNNNSLRKNSSVSSPDSDQSSGFCNDDVAAHPNQVVGQQQLPRNESIDRSMEKQKADNKIRIKINQKN